MASVNDEDMSIRLRALDLISAMVNQFFCTISHGLIFSFGQVDQQNLQSIVQQLLSHLVQSEAQTAAQSLQQTVSGQTSTSTPPTQSPAYRLLLSQRIISICSQDTYSNVTDFEWYLSVLVDLAYVARVNVGAAIKAQMVDVVARVRQARPYAVTLAVKLLSDDALMAGPDDENSCIEVLWAAAWIVGEYCRLAIFLTLSASCNEHGHF
jgi:AP-3 complex subunit delta